MHLSCLGRAAGLTLFAFAALSLTSLSRGEDKPDFTRWEKTIEAFEQQDKDRPPPKNAILFGGSSTIRLWDLPASFPRLDVINRGFGGSQIADSVYFAPRIITKYEPRIVVFYAGDNDVAAGKKPEQVLEDFQALVKAIHKDLPKTKILFVSIKPSPSRLKFFETQKKANALVEDFCKKNELLTYVDVVKPMLDDDGKPREELFTKDNLHMNAKGYELWASILKPYLKPREE